MIGSAAIRSAFTGALERLRQLAHVLRRYRRSSLLLLALLVTGGLFQGVGLSLIVPLITVMLGQQGEAYLARLAGYGVTLDPRMATLAIAAAIVVTTAVSQAIAIWRVAVTTRLNYALCRDWQKSLFNNMLDADLVAIRSEQVGARLQMMLHHPMHAAKFVRRHIDLCYQLVNLAVLFAVLLLSSPMMTIAVFSLFMTANLTMARPLHRSVLKEAHAMRGVFDDLSGYAAEQLMGLAQIKLYGARDARWKGWAARIGAYARMHQRQIVREEMAAGILPVITAIIVLAMLGYMLLRRDIDPAEILATAGLFVVLGARMQTAFATSQRIHMEIGTLLPSFRLTMEHASRRQDSVEGARAIERVAEEVVFDDVRYAYDNSDGVSHLSFSLPRGTITGLFGPSGSGKSTTVALLAGLLRPQAGRILIDGTDLADILPAAWHRRIAVVMQDAPLFTGTVRENILMGRPDADEAAVVGAAKQAAVHDTILRLPQGYDTQIAERGQSLSGGQAQRIALARALVREPDLLILDEATNALDEVTQGLVLEVLHDFAGRGGIVLIVTHRPEVIRSINRVIDLGPAARGADAQPRRPAVASR